MVVRSCVLVLGRTGFSTDNLRLFFVSSLSSPGALPLLQDAVRLDVRTGCCSSRFPRWFPLSFPESLSQLTLTLLRIAVDGLFDLACALVSARRTVLVALTVSSDFLVVAADTRALKTISIRLVACRTFRLQLSSLLYRRPAVDTSIKLYGVR